MQETKKNDNLTQFFSQIETVYTKLVGFLAHDQRISITSKETSLITSGIATLCSNNEDFFANQNSNPRSIYHWISKKIQEFLKTLNNEIDILNESQPSEILLKFINHWEKYLLYSFWLNKNIYYLKYFLESDKIFFLMECHKTFRSIYFDQNKSKLIKSVIVLINNERNDLNISSSEVCKTVNNFRFISYEKEINIVKELPNNFYWSGIYESHGAQYYKITIEEEIIKFIRNLYSTKINDWLKESTPDYVLKALKSLEIEGKLADKYYPYSKHIIMNELENIIITEKAMIICRNRSGVGSMLEKKRNNELKDLYKFLIIVPENISVLAQCFKEYLEQQGNSYSQDSELNKNPIEYINKIISFKAENESLLNNEFCKNILIQKTFENSFQIILNNFDRSTRFLAIYSDNELKRGIKGLSEAELEVKLSQISSLFRYLHSRDAFLKDYTKFLASRLMNETSLSNEAEKNLITKLKTECGQTAVSKILKMREDIDESKELINDLRNFCDQRNFRQELIFQFKILTSGCWPEFRDENELIHFRPCSQIQNIITTFDEFYNIKYNGSRNLKWIFNEGSVEIKSFFKNGNIFVVSNIQLSCLFLICENTQISSNNLANNLNIPELEINNNLENLIQLNLIMKKFDGTLYINKDFNDQKKRIICNIKAKPNETVVKNNRIGEDAKLKEERNNHIDAAIVRVMKSRKTLKLNEIISDVVKILTLFKPNVIDIKSRNESLIERGYIRRDEKEPNVFIYVP